MMPMSLLVPKHAIGVDDLATRLTDLGSCPSTIAVASSIKSNSSIFKKVVRVGNKKNIISSHAHNRKIKSNKKIMVSIIPPLLNTLSVFKEYTAT